MTTLEKQLSLSLAFCITLLVAVILMSAAENHERIKRERALWEKVTELSKRKCYTCIEWKHGVNGKWCSRFKKEG